MSGQSYFPASDDRASLIAREVEDAADRMMENALPFLLAMMTRTTYDEASDITDMASVINAMRATALFSVQMLNERGHMKGARGFDLNDPDEREHLRKTILGNFNKSLSEAFDRDWFHRAVGIAETWSDEEIENYFYGPGCAD